jgi:glycosyltransferase involved in cell wall biosynthesis
MPKVSIITPCYNSEKYIGRTIESVQAQTMTDWEHIVVDDGSSDSSAAVVKSCFTKEPRLRLLEQKNGGCAQARNAGFQQCSNESGYLLFLDADDCLEPEMLETLCGYLDQHPLVGMTYCQFQLVDADDRFLWAEEACMKPVTRFAPQGLGVRALKPEEAQTPLESIFTLNAGIIPSLAVFRRSVYETTSGWDEDMGIIYEDVGLYLEVALRSHIHYRPLPLVRYRRHPAQSTDPSIGREREGSQQAKLYEKWNAVADLPADQQAKLDAARAFREGRMVPYCGFQTGIACLRNREWRKAVRFCGGAIRRYAASFL